MTRHKSRDMIITSTLRYRINRWSLFRSTSAATERATFTVQWRSADAASCTRRQQSRLLQHGAMAWDLWITSWSTPVSAECHWSVGILGKAVRTRDSTSPWPSLVESPGKNQVPSLCSDAPHMTQRTWHRAADLAETLQLTYRHVNTSSSSVNRYANSGRPVDQSDNTRWPSVSCGCCTHLERYSLLAKSCSVTEVVQAPL